MLHFHEPTSVLPGQRRVIRLTQMVEGVPARSFTLEETTGVDNHDVQVVEAVQAPCVRPAHTQREEQVPQQRQQLAMLRKSVDNNITSGVMNVSWKWNFSTWQTCEFTPTR